MARSWLAVVVGLLIVAGINVVLPSAASSGVASAAPTRAPGVSDAAAESVPEPRPDYLPVSPDALSSVTVSTPDDCYGDPDETYTGSTGCVPGELVTVEKVLDSGTMQLADGRRVRLAGVVLPAATSCAGPAALQQVRQRVQGMQVNLHRQSGGHRGRSGVQWVYLQVDEFYGTDLGNELVQNGWASSTADSPANGPYLANLASAEQVARTLHSGQFGPPCGAVAPPVRTDPTPKRSAPTPPKRHDVLVRADGDRHERRPLLPTRLPTEVPAEVTTEILTGTVCGHLVC
ncbi:MAG TPA: hypothetical protein VGH99_14390 [Pseudonocardia sp.]|jgi:endonuclease YncB( thermonuclease family)